MFSVRSLRGPGLLGAGLAVLDRPVGSLSSNGLGKTTVVPEERGPKSCCAFSDSGYLGISLTAKRPCGGRGGRTGAPDIEGAGDVRRLSGGATVKDGLDISGPLLAELARDTWSSGRKYCSLDDEGWKA